MGGPSTLSDKELLESLYFDVEYSHQDKHGKHNWSFMHQVCGTRQTWVIGNVKKQLRLRPQCTPCRACGGKERMAVAMTAYCEKYGIKDVHVWQRYRKKVRHLTELTYRKHIAEINPAGHKRTRGSKGWHLDHKKPTVRCYLDGDPPEFAARKENLEVILAFKNLSKGRKYDQGKDSSVRHPMGAVPTLNHQLEDQLL